MIRKDSKFSLGYAKFEVPVGLTSKKGWFWNSRDPGIDKFGCL